MAPAAGLSLRRQCQLLGVQRSGYYYEPCPESPQNLRLMRRLDEMHLQHPVYGRPRLTVELQRDGWRVNEKRHEIYPYLLRNKAITGPDQVWCADITYIPMRHGFMYLMAVMDWWSRYVLTWELSNTLEAAFCVQAWELALARGKRPPLISNTDQGAQFTATEYVGAVEQAGVLVSMDGRGRWMDNRFIERLWRSYKYEDVYLREYEHGLELRRGTGQWFAHYNDRRPHQALGYATPAEVYHAPESHGASPASWA